MKIGDLLAPASGPSSFTRDRPDDPIEVCLTVKLRDGRTVEVEFPKGVRPKVDLTVDNDPGGPWLDFGAMWTYQMTESAVRIVVEADTRDGRAEDDGSLFRFTAREPKEVETT